MRVRHAARSLSGTSVASSLRQATAGSNTISSEAAELQAEVQSIYRSALEPVNARVLGPLESNEMTPLPFVFLLGNHSSGKSTFINYVMGRDIQSVGVAPTDDSFSIICSGPQDMDQDGHAVVGDPDFGFGGLRPYGTTLLNHLNLKVRANIAVDNIMLVDSPGMIDSPTELADLLARTGSGRDFEVTKNYYLFSDYMTEYFTNLMLIN
jgi:ribosome biogenesis GTPase A